MFSKTDVTGIQNSSVFKVINPLQKPTNCGHSCLLNEACLSFAVLQHKTDQSKMCVLMNKFQLCKSQVYDPNYDLVGYYENRERTSATIEKRKVNQVTLATSLNVSDVESTWPRECWSPGCPIEAVIGFHDYHKPISGDIDNLICGKHSSEMILQGSKGTHETVSSNKSSRCPPNHLLTGIHDVGRLWHTPDYYKCLLLTSPWKTDDKNCRTVEQRAKEVVCPLIDDRFSYVVGFWKVDNWGIDGMTCCPVVKTH
ncbi:Uncharacterised protein g3270 [Pycnogonum litorale]